MGLQILITDRLSIPTYSMQVELAYWPQLSN